jgi:thymidylate synthase
MCRPIVSQVKRNLSRKFLFAEPWWILTGQRFVSPLAVFNKKMYEFSDDGLTLSGAYGPPIVSQLKYICETLRDDPDSRQAVLTIWERNPRESRDIPCTVAMQFLIRNGLLNTIVSMRSSDTWLGLPYDIFTFTCVSAFIAIELRERYGMTPVLLGGLQINAGSQHLYDTNHEAAVRCLAHSVVQDYHPLLIGEFVGSGAFIDFLYKEACAVKHPFKSLQ